MLGKKKGAATGPSSTEGSRLRVDTNSGNKEPPFAMINALRDTKSQAPPAKIPKIDVFHNTLPIPAV
jgi:hypothetical protein